MAYALRATEKVNCVTEDEELRKRGYTVGVTLGEGSYAKVKSAISEKLGKKVALKIINRRKAPKDFQQRFLPRELEIIKNLNHPNVVAMYETMHFNGKVYIAMEIAGHGDLLEYIKLRGAVGEERGRVMFQQLVDAVDYLHNHNIVHRDLKCENILLDVHNNLKISDFGFARFMRGDELSKTFCGSAAYAAPEILQGKPYSGPAYDIWSMGVVLYIMVCGSMPYDDSNIKKMIRYQTERKVGFSRHKNISDECKNLVHNMLEAVVDNRATVATINVHPWLNRHGTSQHNQAAAASAASVAAAGGGAAAAGGAAAVLDASRAHDSRSRSPRTTATSRTGQRPQSVQQSGQPSHPVHPSTPGPGDRPAHHQSVYGRREPHPGAADAPMDAMDDRVRLANKVD